MCMIPSLVIFCAILGKKYSALPFGFLFLFKDTALHVASRKGHAAAVELLLCVGAQLTKNNDNLSFFDIAIQEKFTEVAFAIVRHER